MQKYVSQKQIGKKKKKKERKKKSWVVGNNYVGLVTKLILAINLVAQ